MTRLTNVSGFLLVVLTSLPASGQDGFVPMFNGVDFSGWVRTNTPAATWSYQDEMVICSGKPIGEIRTEKMYQNFVMELEWRHMVPGGNAGIFVWADDITSRGVPFHRGIEVQVLENAFGNNRSHTTHGDIFPIHGATMVPINGRGGKRAFPTESRSNPSPEWNHYRIECRDGEISLAVNGKVVTRGKECVPRKGYICLESEGGVVHYRNVRIQELPSSAVDPDHVAIANRGYRSLYSGLDLDGWEPTISNGSWQTNDWVLAFRGKEGDQGTLTSVTELDEAAIVIDVRLKAATSGAVIDAGEAARIDFSAEPIRTHLEKQGRWNRVELSVRKDDPWLEINGQRVEFDPKTNTVNKVTLSPLGPVDFSNLYGAAK